MHTYYQGQIEADAIDATALTPKVGLDRNRQF